MCGHTGACGVSVGADLVTADADRGSLRRYVLCNTFSCLCQRPTATAKRGVGAKGILPVATRLQARVVGRSRCGRRGIQVLRPGAGAPVRAWDRFWRRGARGARASSPAGPGPPGPPGARESTRFSGFSWARGGLCWLEDADRLQKSGRPGLLQAMRNPPSPLACAIPPGSMVGDATSSKLPTTSFYVNVCRCWRVSCCHETDPLVPRHVDINPGSRKFLH